MDVLTIALQMICQDLDLRQEQVEPTERRIRQALGGQRHYVNRLPRKTEMLRLVAQMPPDMTITELARSLNTSRRHIRRTQELLEVLRGAGKRA